MSYKSLQKSLGISYSIHKNIKAKEKLLYAIKLFSIEDDGMNEQEITECKRYLKIL